MISTQQELMMRKDLKVLDSKVFLILGFTFKGACLPKVSLPAEGRPVRRNARKGNPDVRNTRVIDSYNELKSFDMDVCVYDHWAGAAEVKHEYGIDMINGGAKPVLEDYSAVIFAVGHQEFKTWDIRKSDQ
jgi:UDP-N-acetyl-D-galactosamine dehydrogenase